MPRLKNIWGFLTRHESCTCCIFKSAENLYFVWKGKVMIEINEMQYKEFAKQFNKEFASKIISAFEDENDDPVRIYADIVKNTNIALVVGWDHFWIAGDTKTNEYDNELIDFIKNHILSEEYLTYLHLDLTSPEWEQKMEKLLVGHIKGTKISLGHRLNKENFKKHHAWRDMIPTGYTIIEYDRLSYEFFEKYGEDRPFFEPDSEKFGVVLIKDDINKIISECFCVGIDKNGIVEVGIDTYEEQYRRKGFAYLVAAAFIERCLAKHFEPNWHCHNTDIASKALADKLGFEVTASKRCSLVLKEK